MKLSKSQFCTAVNNYKSMLREEDEILDFLHILPEWKPGEWINTYYDFLTEMCELKDDYYIGTILDWFCFETKFGEDIDCKVFDGSKTWTINSPEILYDYIMEVELEEY